MANDVTNTRLQPEIDNCHNRSSARRSSDVTVVSTSKTEAANTEGRRANSADSLPTIGYFRFETDDPRCNDITTDVDAGVVKSLGCGCECHGRQNVDEKMMNIPPRSGDLLDKLISQNRRLKTTLRQVLSTRQQTASQYLVSSKFTVSPL